MSETLTPQGPFKRRDRLRYEPSPGSHVNEACKEAVAPAINSGKEVSFTFNDIEMVALPTESWKSVAARWDAESTRLRREYRNSPEGKKAAENRKNNIRHQQLLTDCSVSVLPAVLGTKRNDDLIEWLSEFTSSTDWIGVNKHCKLVADLLEVYGYKENDLTGNPPDYFNTRERMARYLVGQAINCLRKGMGPHPIMHKFIEQYRLLPLLP